MDWDENDFTWDFSLAPAKPPTDVGTAVWKLNCSMANCTCLKRMLPWKVLWSRTSCYAKKLTTRLVYIMGSIFRWTFVPIAWHHYAGGQPFQRCIVNIELSEYQSRCHFTLRASEAPYHWGILGDSEEHTLELSQLRGPRTVGFFHQFPPVSDWRQLSPGLLGPLHGQGGFRPVGLRLQVSPQSLGMHGIIWAPPAATTLKAFIFSRSDFINLYHKVRAGG